MEETERIQEQALFRVPFFIVESRISVWQWCSLVFLKLGSMRKERRVSSGPENRADGEWFHRAKSELQKSSGGTVGPLFLSSWVQEKTEECWRNVHGWGEPLREKIGRAETTSNFWDMLCRRGTPSKQIRHSVLQVR